MLNYEEVEYVILNMNGYCYNGRELFVLFKSQIYKNKEYFFYIDVIIKLILFLYIIIIYFMEFNLKI